MTCNVYVTGNRSALEAPAAARTSQAITYPGYTYSSSGYSSVATTRPTVTPASMSLTSTTPSAAAAAAAAMAAVTYPGLSAAVAQAPPPTVPPVGLASRPTDALQPHSAVQYPTTYMSASGMMVHSQPPPTAAAKPGPPELHDRILSLIKTNSVTPVMSAASLPPVGVPPPVPAPAPAMPPMMQRNGSEALYAMQQQQQQQQQLAKDKAQMGMPQPSPYLSAYGGWPQ